MVPVGTLVMLALCALVGIAAPVALAWWLVKKQHTKLTTILVGAGVFFVFALLLEPLLHQVVLKGPNGAAITGNIWYYALYGGLAAGIFEETGRFLGMKFLLKKEPNGALPAVAYGTGHGGMEILMIFGVTMISNLAISLMINAGQADTILAAVPAETQGQVEAQFAQLQGLNAGELLLGFWERISALILQLGLSVIVWTAIRKGGKWLWLFPAAILLHALVDACAVTLSKSVSVTIVELIICSMAIAVGAAGYMLVKKL
ncbi:MAG: YhfC family intramembrane metalloprotease [Bacteroidales bacterium]|nr:YhfC family intramembrane metalloprotease [Bacteroidales bacterium]